MLPVKPFIDFVEQNHLFAHDSKILAALSGGTDSVLMVHLLKAAGFNFGIAHCNFQLRGDESLRDREFCSRLASQLDVPFHVTAFDTSKFAAGHKVSTQMAARQLRYQWFSELSHQHGYTCIALAHHQNDAIETILLNLTRGTGIAGMHGILPKNGDLVRPLLFLNRDEIENIVAENKIPYVEDSSNASSKYARNKLRLEVIPVLRQLNPALEQTFENNLNHFRELELLLGQRIAELKEQLFVYHDEEVHLPLDAIKTLHPKRSLLFNLLKEYGFNETTITDLIAALDAQPGKVFQSAGFVLLLDRGKLILSKKNTSTLSAVQINQNDRHVTYGSHRLNILHDNSPLIIKDNPMATSVDAALLVYPLTLRAWQQGDYFYPLEMRSRKKLSDFFIDQKVPLHKKDTIPVLVNGSGEVIWIGGYRPDDRYKITDKTKKVTIFELI